MSELHVVLGAGQVGSKVAARLRERGLRVRLVRRGRFGAVPPGVETAAGDAADAADMARVLAGAAVAYHCVNPPYQDWAAELPRITEGVIAGAARTRTRLVVLDNLYAYGDTARMNEDTPVAPVSRKGVLRARAAERLLAAHAAGDVRVVIGRASDFYGPETTLAHFGDRFFRRIFAGKPGECIGDPGALHTYSYTPDVARALVTLGLDDRGDGRVWMLPVQPAETTLALASRLGRALGLEVEMTRLPKTLMRMIGLFVPAMSELVEMTCQFDRPFTVDDARFRSTFGDHPEDRDAAAAATARWAAATYERRCRAPAGVRS